MVWLFILGGVALIVVCGGLKERADWRRFLRKEEERKREDAAREPWRPGMHVHPSVAKAALEAWAARREQGEYTHPALEKEALEELARLRGGEDSSRR
jgi:FMN phosphatase YigB (HAD superfamily)